MAFTDDDPEVAAVLAANETFYHAFATGDYAIMAQLWTRAEAASCVHPGWPPVHGRGKVLETWRGILGHPPRPAIRTVEPAASVHGDTALVVCWEAIGEIYLVASNLFVREDGEWRLVHHQSGQTEKRPKTDISEATRTIH